MGGDGVPRVLTRELDELSFLVRCPTEGMDYLHAVWRERVFLATVPDLQTPTVGLALVGAIKSSCDEEVLRDGPGVFQPGGLV